MIWTQTKQIGPIQNDWYSTKMIWTVQNHFGPIEGQGMRILQKFRMEFRSEEQAALPIGLFQKYEEKKR